LPKELDKLSTYFIASPSARKYRVEWNIFSERLR
jgi:hypothetical protein